MTNEDRVVCDGVKGVKMTLKLLGFESLLDPFRLLQNQYAHM
jgi:hypothetical protein